MILRGHTNAVGELVEKPMPRTEVWILPAGFKCREMIDAPYFLEKSVYVKEGEV
jgi:hypothetical protein